MRLDALLLALVPLAWLPANHYFPWGSAWQDGLALLLTSMGLASMSRPAQLPWTWVALVALALGSILVQWSTGHILFAGDAWMAALYVSAFALALAAGSTLVDHDPPQGGTRLEALCIGLVLAALLSAGVGFAQWAGVQNLGIFGADIVPGSRPFANFGQPNHWCTASMLGLAAAWVLYEARRIQGLSLGLIAAVLLAAVVVSGSRTGWLQLIVAVAVFMGLKHRAAIRVPGVGVVIALAATVAAWILWPQFNQPVEPGTVPAAARSLAEQAQAGVRLPLWAALIDAIALQPWVGYGWQQVVLAQQAVALQGAPLPAHFEQAHNLVLDLFIWVGLPLGLVLLGLAAWAMARLVLRSRDPQAAGLLFGAGAVLMHALVEYPIEYAYFLIPLGLILGAAHRLTPARSANLPAPSVRLLGAGLLLVLCITAFDYLKAEQGYRMLRLESARIGVDRVETAPPDLLVLTQLEAFIRFMSATPAAGSTALQLEEARQVARRFANPATQLRLASLLALNGDPRGAERQLQLLCAMHTAARCQAAIDHWRSRQLEEPAFQAVPAPSRSR